MSHPGLGCALRAPQSSGTHPGWRAFTAAPTRINTPGREHIHSTLLCHTIVLSFLVKTRLLFCFLVGFFWVFFFLLSVSDLENSFPTELSSSSFSSLGQQQEFCRADDNLCPSLNSFFVFLQECEKKSVKNSEVIFWKKQNFPV